MISPDPRATSRTLPVVLGSGVALLTLGWIVAALLMANRGFDISDEGFYLLSYRWWDSTPRTFTGVQYIYGPVFEVFGYSVPALRVVRLLTILGAHAVLAWSVVTWIQVQPGARRLSAAWARLAGLAIVASGGIVYGWMPLSPSYNDVATLVPIVIMAAVLRSHRAVLLERRLPVLPALAIGPLALLLALAKWSSGALVLVFIGLVAVVSLRWLGAHGWVRYLTFLAVGLVAALVVVDLSIVPLGSLVDNLVTVNRLVASNTNSPVHLLGMYLRTGFQLVGAALALCVPAVVLVAAARLSERTGHQTVTRVALVAAPIVILLVASPARLGLVGGGVSRIDRYSAVLVALMLVAAVTAYRSRVDGRDVAGRSAARARALLLASLVLVPVVGSAGTGNPIYALAVNGLGCWLAVIVWWASSMTPSRLLPLAVSTCACVVVVATTTGIDGLLVHPYRAASYSDATARVGGDGKVASQRVSTADAARFAALRDVIGDASSAGRPMMAFDELSGLVLMLDAHSVGEAWYSASDHPRSAAGIESACAHGNPWGDRQPVLLFDREPTPVDTAALARCGLSLTDDFERVAVPGYDPALDVYLPVKGIVQ